MTSYLQTLKSLQNQEQLKQSSAPYQQEHIETQQSNTRSVPARHNKSPQYSEVRYVPHKAKVLDYEDRLVVERVPRTRKVLQYEQRVISELVPRQVFKTQYYAVQHIKSYEKQIVPEVSIQYVPVQRKVKRIQYVPVQKQVVYYPQSLKAGDEMNISKIAKVDLLDNGVSIQQNFQIRPLSNSNFRTNNIEQNNYTRSPISYRRNTNQYPKYQYTPSTHQYTPSTHQYTPSTHQYTPSTHQYTPSTHQYTPSTHQYTPSTHQYTPSTHFDNQDYDYIVQRDRVRPKATNYSYDQNYYKNKYYLSKLRNRFGIEDTVLRKQDQHHYASPRTYYGY